MTKQIRVFFFSIDSFWNCKTLSLQANRNSAASRHFHIGFTSQILRPYPSFTYFLHTSDKKLIIQRKPHKYQYQYIILLSFYLACSSRHNKWSLTYITPFYLTWMSLRYYFRYSLPHPITHAFMPKCFITFTHTYMDSTGANQGSLSCPSRLQYMNLKSWRSNTDLLTATPLSKPPEPYTFIIMACLGHL